MKVLTLGSDTNERVVLFATGAGGDPERYAPFLAHLAGQGCQVIAPYFERLVPREATTAELIARPAGLVEALHRRASPDAAVTVVGHSIGGWAALCLAGATPWGQDGKPLDVPREPRVGRLVLYAPAAGWFGAPGALDAVTTPMLVYVGDLDTVTPVEQVAVLKNARAEVDLRVIPKAGHFSFMNVLPPGVTDDAAFDRDRFLTDLAQTTLEFARGADGSVPNA
jgi:pimeloyl-ACP methyl ester carboxylesterase